MKKNFLSRLTAICCAAAISASLFSVTASAQTATWELYKDQTISYSTKIGLYTYGKINYLKTSSSSNDGVNLYLDYSLPGEGWNNALHVFAEKGCSASHTTPHRLSEKGSWRGNMNSWWWNGKNCRASGKIEAYN